MWIQKHIHLEINTIKVINCMRCERSLLRRFLNLIWSVQDEYSIKLYYEAYRKQILLQE